MVRTPRIVSFYLTHVGQVGTDAAGLGVRYFMATDQFTEDAAMETLVRFISHHIAYDARTAGRSSPTASSHRQSAAQAYQTCPGSLWAHGQDHLLAEAEAE